MHRSAVLALTAAAVMLGACESARKVVGNVKAPPDEFAVYSRPPLSLPPDYGLRPPEPGRSRPQVITPTVEAKAAILGKPATIDAALRKAGNSTPGTLSLLKATGGINADPSIREVVNQETSILSEEDQRFLDKLIFWVEDKPYEGVVVDAAKEQKRIQKNQALGKEINEGETPQIKRKRGIKGLLEF